MISAAPVLIVEDEILIGLELADAVIDLGGLAVGPVATVAEALVIIENYPIAAAILDANLEDRDITPVALWLAAAGIPLVIHTAKGLPTQLAALRPDLAVVMKPAPARVVVEHLLHVIGKAVIRLEPEPQIKE